MNKKRIVKKIELMGWNVEIDNNSYTLSKKSPAGQDFNFEIEVDDMNDIDQVRTKFMKCIIILTFQQKLICG